MKAKEYLSRARYINLEITAELEAIAAMRTLAEKCTASLHAAPGGSGSSRQLEDICIKIRLAEQKVDSDIDELIRAKEELSRKIDSLEKPLPRTLLTLRYVCFMRWGDIAERLGYSESYIYSLHDEALKEMDEILSRAESQ